MGTTYLKICTCLSLGSIGYTVYERFLQATGKTMLSTISQISGAVTNIVLDYIFIFPLNMGVAGAAWATIIGQFVSLFIAMFFHYTKNKEINGKLKYIKPEIGIIKGIYKIGISAAIMQALLSVMMAGMNAILGGAKADPTIKEAEQKKNDLIMYMAHDLKTPLTSVIGYLTLLNEEKRISKDLQEKYMKIALDKSIRLEELTNQFFEITRYNLNDMPINKIQLNLSILFDQLIEEFYPMLEDRKLELKVNKPNTLIYNADGDKIARAFGNLLKNAISYSYENTVIEIEMIDNEENIEVTFRNKGATIPEYKLEKIFDKFYRADEDYPDIKINVYKSLSDETKKTLDILDIRVEDKEMTAKEYAKISHILINKMLIKFGTGINKQECVNLTLKIITFFIVNMVNDEK